MAVLREFMNAHAPPATRYFLSRAALFRDAMIVNQ